MSLKHSDTLAWAHPLVRDWFLARFGKASLPQVAGWPYIVAGKATLISAPTGTGKTLAAFLACINDLVVKSLAGDLQNKTELVYVSPLKALSNDVHKNLEEPLSEIRELAQKRGINMMPICTSVRTGDTLAAERRSMLKNPPHILVTTPESLYILLTAEKSRETLRHVKTVIVDEIHAVADDKRGAHLSLSLERLDRLAEKKPVRIGLSATQKPLETVARFLVGNEKELPVIINEGQKRELDLAVEVPGIPLGAVSTNEQWSETYDKLTELINKHRSTIIFVNTRKLAERVTMHLAERLGEDAVAAHHGSLSFKLRQQAERRLKKGELKAIVATASLELGIDVGSIDLTCLLGSPRSISVALQRIGRSGHFAGAIPKGRIFPGTRDELLESAALVKAIRDGDLDLLQIPESPLDILAQQIVAITSAEEVGVQELFSLVKNAAPYKNLSKEQYHSLLEMLAEGISARRGRYSAYLHYNRVADTVKARRGARLAAITNGGAIPETGLYTVVAEPDETAVGTVDEDFAVESNAGDVFLLGSTSWRIRRVESARSRVLVEDAKGSSPTIPFWLGEAPARSQELSLQIAELRKRVSDMIPEDLTLDAIKAQYPGVSALLRNEYGLDESGAEQVVEYILEARRLLTAMPTQDLVIAERFFDEAGGMQLVIHAPFGARINRAWGLALRKCFCRSFNFELQAAATDNGINISLGEQHSFPLSDVFSFLSANSVKDILEQASLASPLFNTRFRWDANRSLALLRFQGGKKVPPFLQRLKSDDLMAAVFPEAAACQDNISGDREIPEHPLVQEVMKDVLTEAMDLPGLTDLLARIESGQLRCLSIDTPMPSAFSHEILNANPYAFLDDAPLEERRARAVELRRSLPENLQEFGHLDIDAINKVKEEIWPDFRDAEELSDFLQTLVAAPQALVESRNKDAFQEFFAQLQKQGRASRCRIAATSFIVCAEKKAAFEAIYGKQHYESPLAELGSAKLTPEQSTPSISEANENKMSPARLKEYTKHEALTLMLQGWLSYLGPVTAGELQESFQLAKEDLDFCLAGLESTGEILRGQFRPLETMQEKANGITALIDAKRQVLDEKRQAADSKVKQVSEKIRETEWCNRRILARIHRMTVAGLRKSIAPVTAAQYMSWLLRWQHVAPEDQLPCDERSCLEIIRQLQGFEIAANAWETQVLSKRLKNYNPEILDRLCMTGKIGWGRLSPHPATLETTDEPRSYRVIPTSVAPIAFFLRDDCDWMTAKHPAHLFEDNKGLSHEAAAIKSFLQKRGASFFADIVKGTNRLPAEIENGLWELVAAGLVSADGFDNLRALIDPKRRAGQGRSRMQRPRHASGRWSLLHTVEVERQKRLESLCKVLLCRYGVVVREVLERESNLPRWRDLLLAFRRLEDRGEIRGGRFVSGFPGEQFALPQALESLRVASKKDYSQFPTMTVSAVDPLNLVGIILPGKKVAAGPHNTVTLSTSLHYVEPEKNTEQKPA